MKRLGLAVGLTLLLVAGGLSAYWLWAAERLKVAVSEGAEELHAQGYQVAYRGPQVGGFPVALDARLEGAEIVAPDGLFWRAAPLDGHLLLLNPTKLQVTFSGSHQIGRAAQVLHAHFQKAVADVLWHGDGRPERLDLDLADIAVRAEEGPEMTATGLRAQLGPVRPATSEQLQAVELWAELSELSLPDGAALPLGPLVTRLAAELTLHGPVIGQDLAQVLVFWQAAGGYLQVRGFELVWGPLSLSLDGRLVLDEAFRLEGQLAVRAAGLPQTLEVLETQGQIGAEHLENARRALEIYAKIPGQSADEISFPLNIRQGVVLLGPLPLLRLAPVL